MREHGRGKKKKGWEGRESMTYDLLTSKLVKVVLSQGCLRCRAQLRVVGLIHLKPTL